MDSAEWGDGRSYNVGLSGRGQKALKDLGVWEEVEPWCSDVVGRMDWSPGRPPVQECHNMGAWSII